MQTTHRATKTNQNTEIRRYAEEEIHQKSIIQKMTRKTEQCENITVKICIKSAEQEQEEDYGTNAIDAGHENPQNY